MSVDVAFLLLMACGLLAGSIYFGMTNIADAIRRTNIDVNVRLPVIDVINRVDRQ